MRREPPDGRHGGEALAPTHAGDSGLCLAGGDDNRQIPPVPPGWHAPRSLPTQDAIVIVDSCHCRLTGVRSYRVYHFARAPARTTDLFHPGQAAAPFAQEGGASSMEGAPAFAPGTGPKRPPEGVSLRSRERLGMTAWATPNRRSETTRRGHDGQREDRRS